MGYLQLEVAGFLPKSPPQRPLLLQSLATTASQRRPRSCAAVARRPGCAPGDYSASVDYSPLSPRRVGETAIDTAGVHPSLWAPRTAVPRDDGTVRAEVIGRTRIVPPTRSAAHPSAGRASMTNDVIEHAMAHVDAAGAWRCACVSSPTGPRTSR